MSGFHARRYSVGMDSTIEYRPTIGPWVYGVLATIGVFALSIPTVISAVMAGWMMYRSDGRIGKGLLTYSLACLMLGLLLRLAFANR